MNVNDYLPINSVINEDCYSFLSKLPDECIDIIITDPPYGISSGNNLSMKNIKNLKGFGGNWNIINEEWDTFSFQEYCNLIKKMMKESYRVLKSSGTAFFFGTYHNTGILNFNALQSNFKIINEIIWFKRNAFPNLSKKCLTASHENILWVCKSDSWNYNYDEMKKAKYPFDRLKESGKQLRSVWDIPNNKQKGELDYRNAFPDASQHVRSQKPLRLIDRCLEITARPGNVVGDWFAGSGTTFISALNHSLAFTGCEINPKFIEVIQWRLNQKKLDN